MTVAKVLARNPASITYCRSDIALSGAVKPLAILTGQNSTAVHLSPEAIQSGAYPFTRPLQLLYDANKGAHREAIERLLISASQRPLRLAPSEIPKCRAKPLHEVMRGKI